MAQKPEQEKHEVAIREQFAVLLRDPTEVKQVIEANIGTTLSPFDLDRVKVPSGGGTLWEIPTLTGLEDSKELTGVIIHWQDVRCYWHDEFSGTGTPPDCASDDGEVGIGNPGGTCKECPFAQWESSPKEGSKAQACKQVRRLFILRPGELLPMLVSVPPTSIGAIKKFFQRLAAQGTPFYGLVTKLELAKTKNAGGISYSEIVPTPDAVVDAETVRVLEGLRETFRPILETAPLTPSDYDAADVTGDAGDSAGADTE